MSEGRKVDEMTKEELEQYHHTPETELSVLVCRAAEKGQFATLKDHLQLMSEMNPKKIHTKDSAGMTSLHCAVACSSLPAVILLLKYGADVNGQDMLGFTPLFLATGRYPNTDIATHLIEDGHASITTGTKTGATALHGAALQGNTDCVKLLLKYGADPRTEDNEGTTAFDLSKDNDIRTILHDAIIEWDVKKETQDVVCCQCKKTPKEGDLKRCSQCHVTLYCSRECQIEHWKLGGHKTNCNGFVLARSVTEQMSDGMQYTSFYHVMGSQKKNVKCYLREASEGPDRMEFLRNKRFIVKVQIPIMAANGDMMVYNADRTCEGFVYANGPGYHHLASRVRKEGMMGIKAFFWAQIADGKDGVFKVFHGKMAPFQNW